MRLPDHHLMVPFASSAVACWPYLTGVAKFFKHKHKIINFNKDFFVKVFGFPVGAKPFVLESSKIITEVEQIRDHYLQGNKQITVIKSAYIRKPFMFLNSDKICFL
jgi:hypothetical protein